ncbi:ProQ/FINO family protein [Reinekea marina]|uniref:ProQ/FINO family protein n=1 Tax=Reinekea marina TaxID=1310421 RepID=A0ABV7WQW5_9GAMM|nr:ProQ/FINO family protein [Reinekea marina]MDN3650391.1 ProQ/FINO family protein [Reinekea marina]
MSELEVQNESQVTPVTEEVSAKQKADAKRQKEYLANRKALDELCELYPEVFNPKEPKPLQIGIHAAIAEDGKLSKTRIRRALNLYVRMRSYIACLKEGAERVTVGGTSTGTVTAEEAQHAAGKLAEIDKKRAARRPAKPAGRKPNKAHPSKAKKADAPKKQPAKANTSAKKEEFEGDSEARMAAKLAALVNKRSN